MAQPPVKEVTEALLDYERRFDVVNARVGRLQVWPLLRLRLLHAYANKAGVADKQLVVPSWKEQLKARCSAWFHKAKPVPRSKPQPPVKAGKSLFWMQATKLEATTDGSLFHKFFHPLLALCDESPDAHQFWCWRDSEPPIALENTAAWDLSRWLDKEAKLGPTFRERQPLNAVATQILADWNAAHPEVAISPSGFLHLCWSVLAWASGFEIAFRQQRPSAVFVTCYYAEPAMALALACNRLGIPCVELQHGQQGAWHSMYTHWSKVPAEGYDLVPNTFWMWGESARKRIAQWHTGTNRSVLVGGNPWLAYHVHGLNKARKANSDAALKNREKPQAKRTVLISLQFAELPKWLWETMPTLGDIHWLFRLHPRFRDVTGAFRNKCVQCLNGSSWELDRPTDADFYEIITEADIHITGWSTTAYEAIAFGVPSILMHPNALDAMGEDIKLGMFAYAADPAALRAAILNPQPSSEAPPAMVTQREVFVDSWGLVQAESLCKKARLIRSY